MEEQFRIMADAAPVLIWLADTDKSSFYFSRKWLQFTGRTPETEIAGSWTNDLHPDDFNRCLDIYIRAFDKRQEFKMEHRLRRFDGEYRWFIHNGVPRYNSDTSFAGYICSCADIHEIKELEKRKDEFISAASHELKTPVTTMKVYLHIIEEYFKQIEDEKHLKFVARADEQVNKLSRIINDLLDLSKIQAGSLAFEFSIVSYCELVKEIVENFQLITASHTIELRGNCTGAIKGDREKLSQALVNLLNNAVKYSGDENKIIIELSETGGFIRTSVKDFGIGIAKKQLRS